MNATRCAIINVLKPKHATVFCNAIATLQTDWNDLPQSSFTVLPLMTFGATWTQVLLEDVPGVKLGSVRSFYGNQRKEITATRVWYARRNTRHNVQPHCECPSRPVFRLFAAEEIPRGHVTVPFCNPAHRLLSNRPAAVLNAETSWAVAVVSATWRPIGWRSFRDTCTRLLHRITTLTGNTSCADARTPRWMLLPFPMWVGAFQECMLSTHLHEHHVKYARGHFFGLIAASRGVKASTSGNCRGHATTNWPSRPTASTQLTALLHMQRGAPKIAFTRVQVSCALSSKTSLHPSCSCSHTDGSHGDFAWRRDGRRRAERRVTPSPSTPSAVPASVSGVRQHIADYAQTLRARHRGNVTLFIRAQKEW